MRCCSWQDFNAVIIKITGGSNGVQLAAGTSEVATDNPCHKKPCQNIAKAIDDSCTPVGSSDFTCKCQASFTWDDSTNSCKGKFPAKSTAQNYVFIRDTCVSAFLLWYFVCVCRQVVL
jgi:hypothetical protein